MHNLRATICAVFAMILSATLSASAATPVHRQIDREIAGRSNGSVAKPATDAEFLRRVSLDLNGVIPTADDVRRFLADKSPGKRTKLIDRLLADAKFARRMREAFTVMLLERRAGRAVSDERWNRYLETAFAKNKPWDKLVAEMLAADGLDEQTAAGMRFFVDGGRGNADQLTRDLGRLFLGMDLQCAQCHDHPNVRTYKQADYFGLFAFVSTSKLKGKYYLATPNGKKVEFQSVFVPDVKNATGPRVPGGREIPLPQFKKGEGVVKPKTKGLPAIPKFRPRQMLAKELASAGNRRFVRNAVNRFWFLLMGRGLVHPLDLIHKDNPPSHPKVLDLLEKEFIAHRFDVKWLLRQLALTQTYQRSSRLPGGVNANDVMPRHYRVAMTKPLSAEQMAWSLLRATGHSLKPAPDAKAKKFNVKDYVNARIPPPDNIADLMTLFGGVFGNPPGEAEVEFNPSSEHSLFLMNDQLIAGWLKPNGSNLIVRLSKQTDTTKAIEELYLAVLSRFPTKAEQTASGNYLDKNKSRRMAALQNLAWALLASAEFRLNH